MKSVLAIGALSVLSLVFVGAGCAAETGDGSESAVASSENVGTVASEAKIDCSYVKCAVPLCGPNQHLVQSGCCPVCKGPSDRCADVMCLAVECAEGEVRVHNGANDCCGTCKPAPKVAECETDLDCPQLNCFACPCPTTSCQGRKCVTQTPDASTCGGAL
jgi:hypothetical protein